MFVTSGNHQARHCIAACGFKTETIGGLDSDGAAGLNDALEIAVRSSGHVIVVDSYRLDASDLGRLRAIGKFVVAIDDLALYPFPCQLVVNGGANASRLLYRSASGDTRFLLGTRYAMLSPEFWSPPRLTVRKTVQRILFTLGGADPHHFMPRLLKLANGLPEDVAITAVIGPFFQNRDEIEHVLAHGQRKVQLVEAPASLLPLMLQADLTVSAGGQTLHELACVGCPTIAVETAPNQRGQLEAFVEHSVLRGAGRADDPGILSALRDTVRSLLEDQDARAAMSAAGQRLVDGQGAQRVARAITEAIGTMQRPSSFKPVLHR